MVAPKPANEEERLRALRDYGILDSEAEPSFDRITVLASRMLEVPIALVSLIDAERQWFKSCVGFGAPETSRDVAFCAYAILQSGVMVIPDARSDGRFAENPLVTGEPHIRAYAGAPLRTPDGLSVGTLCAIDRRPRNFTHQQLATLVDLAQIVVDEMELRRHARARKVFERVTELSPNMVYLMDVPRRRVAWSSRRTEALLGFELDDLSAQGLARNMPEDDAARASRNLARAHALPDGEPHQATYQVHGPGGEPRWMLVRATPFARDARGEVTELLAVATDVTALALAEARASESERGLAGRVGVLEAILETAGEGILVADEQAQIIIANPLARLVTGRGPGDSLSSDPRVPGLDGFFEVDGVTPFDPQRLPFARALAGEETKDLALYVKNPRFPDGIYLILTGRPVRDGDGKVRGAVVTLADVTALHRAQERLSALAITDELTGLPNRRALRDRLELLSAEAARGRRFSVALIDLDHFKRVNDTHGHATGDAVLVAVGDVLRSNVRRSDLVARMGGEELCVIQTDVDPAEMVALTERLRAAIAALTAPVPVTASFGVCHSSTTSDPTMMLAAADAALYAAKRAGRNCVHVAE